MKQLMMFLIILLGTPILKAQDLSYCNVVEWTLDDLNFTPQNSFEFGALINQNCGCTNNGYNVSNCVLVKITLTKTINGQAYNHDCSKLLYTGG